jgi:hypothetical protein
VILRAKNKTQSDEHVPLFINDFTLIFKKANKRLPKIKMVLVEHYLIMTVDVPNTQIYYVKVN